MEDAWRNGEWVTHGIDPAETRYSPLDQIDRSSASRLGLAWTSVAGEGGGNQEATPLFSSGVLYAITNWSIVFALDASMRTRTLALRPQGGPGIQHSGGEPRNLLRCRQPRDRAPRRKVLAPVIDGRMVALDGKSGALRWSTRFSRRLDWLLHHDGAARGREQRDCRCGGGEFTPHRGFFAAFDVESGRESWRFYTVPGDPSKPFENKAIGGGRQDVVWRVVEVRRRWLALGRPPTTPKRI